MWVERTETAIKHEPEDMRNAEMVELTTGYFTKWSEEMLNALGDSLSDVARSNDGEVDEEDKELGKLSDNDEPGWVMGTVSKTLQQCMESFQEK